MQGRPFLFVMALCTFCAFSSFTASAFDYDAYPPSTIQEEFTATEARGSSIPGYYENPNQILFAPLRRFSASAAYLGQIREISEVNVRCLDIAQRTYQFQVALSTLYLHELLVRDSDGREYWLPIQETHLESFREEYYEGCQLTLYLVWMLNFEHQPFVLINEFWVQ